MQRASILALGTAVPKTELSQDLYNKSVTKLLSLNEMQSAFLEKVIAGTAIDKRHTVVADIVEGTYCGVGAGQPFPSTEERNKIYKKEAPKLAEEACVKALDTWGGNASDLTHVISISCTGMMAPGIEFLLIRDLGLSPAIERLGINFMGCFGAFKGLATAKAIALENPKHRVLVVCTELCSLHFQEDTQKDALVGNSIFGDGAAAVVVGASPKSYEKPLFEIHSQRSHAFIDTHDLMSWEVGNQGYKMRLSSKIPNFLESHIVTFANELLGPNLTNQECSWALHPGGKAILEGLIKACNLSGDQVSHSWEVLKKYGNMSSGTILFVLEELLKTPKNLDWVVSMGFGPGLSVEGMLFKRFE